MFNDLYTQSYTDSEGTICEQSGVQDLAHGPPCRGGREGTNDLLIDDSLYLLSQIVPPSHAAKFSNVFGFEGVG